MFITDFIRAFWVAILKINRNSVWISFFGISKILFHPKNRQLLQPPVADDSSGKTDCSTFGIKSNFCISKFKYLCMYSIQLNTLPEIFP